MNASISLITLGAINARNELFWAKQSRLTKQRIANRLCYDAAKRDMNSEAIRVAFRERKSLDQALSDADITVKRVRRSVARAERERRRSISRIGGLSPKTDALQILIQRLVREMPGMSRRDLWHRLKDELGNGTISVIDGKEIKFLTASVKIRSCTGLKDRLHRATRK
jgi:hypothetical protein